MNKKPLSQRYIKLNAAEHQSGLDRVRHAELLILQLPENHDGANTWLLNYGTGERAVQLRKTKGFKFISETRCCETSSSARKENADA